MENANPNHIKLTSNPLNVTRISYGNDKSNEKKTIKRKCLNGDIYEGEVDTGNGKFDGKGKITFHDGGSFDGIFENDTPLSGQYNRDDGVVYNGEVASDYSPNGNGEVIFTDGTNFVGTFNDGRPVNVEFTQYGNTYKGEVDENYIPNGNGVMKFPGNIVETGTFVNGILKTGERDYYNSTNLDAFGQAMYKAQCIERRVENGEFINNILQNGRIEQGENHILIKNGQIYHGDCTNFIYQNNIYSGNYDQGSFNGDVFDISRQYKFCGTMKEGMPQDGNGTFVTQSIMINDNNYEMPISQIYNGKWENGKFSGTISSYTYDGIFNSQTTITSDQPEHSSLYSQNKEMYRLSQYDKKGNARSINESERSSHPNLSTRYSGSNNTQYAIR